MKPFEWDKEKNKQNIKKHGVTFRQAQKAFDDINRIIFEDTFHSTKKEKRYFCIGMVKDAVCTVRFTYRKNYIRIFGAGFWRKEKKKYEKEKK